MGKTLKGVAVLAALCLLLFGLSPTAAVAGGKGRVGDFSAKAMKVRLDKASGGKDWRKVSARTKVFLKDASGDRSRADLNELTRGARVLGTRVEGGAVAAITLRELASTGSADCSFDSADDDGDDVTVDDSFDCSHDYDDGKEATDADCSYDSSREGPRNDFSLDASWDCSYSQINDATGEEFEWDCSYSASASGYFDPDGGDVDADLDFDCSWSGSDDPALWDCKFLPGVFGFKCVSKALNQEFEYTVDADSMQIVGGMDFQRDVVDGDDDGGTAGCAGGAAAGSYDCSFDGEAGDGDCDSDWSFDASGDGREGDLSGDMSYSCSWDR